MKCLLHDQFEYKVKLKKITGKINFTIEIEIEIEILSWNER